MAALEAAVADLMLVAEHSATAREADGAINEALARIQTRCSNQRGEVCQCCPYSGGVNDASREAHENGTGHIDALEEGAAEQAED